jgi:hypothetical protein
MNWHQRVTQTVQAQDMSHLYLILISMWPNSQFLAQLGSFSAQFLCKQDKKKSQTHLSVLHWSRPKVSTNGKISSVLLSGLWENETDLDVSSPCFVRTERITSPVCMCVRQHGWNRKRESQVDLQVSWIHDVSHLGVHACIMLAADEQHRIIQRYMAEFA